MNQTTDYAAVRAALEEKLQELTARVEGIEADLSQPGNDDWEERAKEVEDDDVLSAVGSLSVREIEQIRLAINQIDAGHYGICVSCGKKIAPARLEALPFVTTCIQCA
jgi:RNA polymerase-binding transcription factor DksA